LRSAIYLVHPVQIASYDYSQVFTTASSQNFLATKGVTQWIFYLSSSKSYCLTFTRICFHPIFYCPLLLGVQILLQLFYDFLFVIFLYIIQLSEKSLTLETMFLQISFTYTRNRSGTKIFPCGTPEVTLTSLDSCPSTLTLCVRRTRNSLTQTTTFESTSEASLFYGVIRHIT